MSAPNYGDALEGLLALAERRQRDPLYRFVMLGDPIRPHTKQLDFLRSTKPQVFSLWANRAGKSRILAAQIASVARFGALNPEDIYTGRVAPDFSPKRLWVIGTSMPRLLESFVPMLFGGPYKGNEDPYIPEEEIDFFDIKRGICRLKTGTLISLLSHEAGREKFQAQSLHMVGFDEVPPLGIFTEATMRQAGNGKPLLVRMAGTLFPPVGFKTSTSWLFERVVKPFQSGRTRDFMDVISASIYDNPGMPKEIIAQYEAMFPVGSVDRQVRLEGKLVPQAFGAPAYGNFNRNLHVNPKITRASVLPRIPLLLSFDVNVRPMTAVVAQEVGSLVRVVDEIFLNYEGKAATLVDLAREFRRRFPSHGAALRIYGDNSAKHHNAQTGKTDLAVLLNEFVGYPAPVETYIPDANPYVHDRINTVNYCLQGVGGVVGIEIAGHCVELIADLEEVQTDGKGGILKSRDAQDAYYIRTHISDALGYLLYQRRPIRVDDRITRRGVVSTPIPGPSYAFGNEDRTPYAPGRAPLIIGNQVWT